MPNLNHYAIGSLLGAQLVGEFEIGHGQIESLGDAQAFLDRRRRFEVFHPRTAMTDRSHVIEAFLKVRDARGDKGSSDLYIADPVRNAEFIQVCRGLGVTESEYVINKSLMAARKAGQLKGLKSKATSVDYSEFAFACEFAATELRYETGASVDDIICHPMLSDRFDAAVRSLSPGHSAFEYRWALLSIRKSGRNSWKEGFATPVLDKKFGLIRDDIREMPASPGVYLLFDEGSRPLYASHTRSLRQAVAIHRKPAILEAVNRNFWQPNIEQFVFKYTEVEDPKVLRPFEQKVVIDERPIFNIPRDAA